MELADYLHILRRRWLLLALVIVVCIGGSAVAVAVATPRYRASTELLVNGSSNVSAANEIVDRQLAETQATAFAQIATTPPAVSAALARAELVHGPFRAAGGPNVSAAASGANPFITITVTDTDPARAQTVANAYVEILPTVLKRLDQASPTAYKIVTLSRAALPTSPYSPNRDHDLLIGLGVGVVIAIAAALARESLDRRLKDSADVEDATSFSVLGTVPYDLPGEPVPAETAPSSVRAEAYRKIRASLAFAGAEGMPRCILVTSATSSEGKTSLATNLALTCARAGQHVALVDADLRRPMVKTYLELADYHPGLVDVLDGLADVDTALQSQVDGQLDVLTSGSVPLSPGELIASREMKELLTRLRASHDLVILDTPPVLPVADGLTLSAHADAVVLVVRLGDTTRERLRRGLDALATVRAPVVGVVPNGAAKREGSAYDYDYSYNSKVSGRQGSSRKRRSTVKSANHTRRAASQRS